MAQAVWLACCMGACMGHGWTAGYMDGLLNGWVGHCMAQTMLAWALGCTAWALQLYELGWEVVVEGLAMCMGMHVGNAWRCTWPSMPIDHICELAMHAPAMRT